MKVWSTTDQRAALEGADYVVVCISTGGFASMTHDLAVPERHGIKQSVGDTVGPGGISRALRNIPVMVGIARDMEDVCPDAWLLNITNPMTTLCRAVTRETEIATVGLCHEVTMAQFTLSQLLDADFRAFDLTVTGVNHLPVVTAHEGRAATTASSSCARCSPMPTGAATNRSTCPKGSATSSTASAASSRSATCSRRTG